MKLIAGNWKMNGLKTGLAELEALIKEAIRLSPSSFNSQSSRAVILFTGALGAIGIVALRELLNWLGIARVTRYDEVPKRAVIVAGQDCR